MRSSTGRWVSGDDFFDRKSELQVLESKVRDGNHVLLTGQRRMGKTSVARELGRRLQSKGWTSLFINIEDASCPEDVIAHLAEAVHPIRPIAVRVAASMGRWVDQKVEEISASEFRVKIRAGLSGSWSSHGGDLIRYCAEHDGRVLLVIDELPIFLMRMLRDDEGDQRVDEFLSWLRGVFQGLEGGSPVLVVSGSVGLAPLVQRLGLPDRINYLYSFRLGPWDRQVSIDCFELLAESNGLRIGEGVAGAVHEALGIGIPHHVQCYFAHLKDFAVMRNLDRVTLEHVDEVYRTELLGPSGQSDIAHYETRIESALDDDTYRIAQEILTEAATQDVFTSAARHCLERLYSSVIADAPRHIGEALDVLVHDGYLAVGNDNGYRFPFRLLKDWWSARFRNHYTPLKTRIADENPRDFR